MIIIKEFIPKGRRNRPGHRMDYQYVTMHNTGSRAPQADAQAHAAYILTDTAANRPASWHFTVDDKVIYQHLPTNENGWHAGDGANGPGNRRSVGIEMCENRGIDFDKSEDMAAKLAAKLLKEKDLPISRLKQHYDWSGKNCPMVLRSRRNGWQDFVNRVIRHMETNALDLDKPIYQGIVLSDTLNIRSGPSTRFDRVNGLVKGQIIDVYAETGVKPYTWLMVGKDQFVSNARGEYVAKYEKPEKEDNTVEKVILVHSMDDIPAARRLASRERCAITFDASFVDAKELIVVGGQPPKGYKGKVRPLGGSDFFKTVANVEKHIR